jgi:hypothetical protein
MLKDDKHYSYPFWLRAIYVLIAMAIAFYVFSNIFLVIKFFIQEASSFSGYERVKVLIMAIVSNFLFLLFSIFILNFQPDLEITSRGIIVQVFLFWKVLVSWSEVIDIRGGVFQWSRYHVVIVDKLTPIHRIYGLIHGFTLKPAIIIGQTMRNREEAIQRIRGKLQKA